MKQKTGRKLLSFLLTLAMVIGLLPGMGMTAYAAGGGTEVTQANVICQQYSYMDADYYSGGVLNDTPPADITNITLADAQAFGAAVNCPTTYWVVVYATDGDNLKWTSNGKTGEQTSTPRSASGRVLSAWCELYNGDAFFCPDPMSDLTFYFSKGLATVAVTGVSLDKTAAQTIEVDGKVSFTATVEPNNATDKTVKWSVGGTDTGAVKLYSDEACTTEVGTDATETLTVYAKGESAGSATVTATSNADSEKKASCDVTVNAAQTQTEVLLTTITATGKEQASYNPENVATVSFSYTANGYSSYTNNGTTATWGWWGYGWSATVNAAEGYTITKCVFYDDKDRTATDSEAPFVVETTEEDKTPKVNGTPILAYQSKGIKKIEVYGYATPTATHSVTITAGDHMTKTADSGDAEQTGLTGAMTDVVYTANEGYYFPTDYSVTTVNGISVTRNSYTQITVSGTPTADATITLTAPTEKDNQSVPETTGFSVTNATNATSADGVISGVTSAMEYSLDGTAWTAVTGTTITGLNPGSVQIRLAGDDTHNASDAVTVAVSDQLADAKTAAKADLDTLLAGKTESNYDADDWTALNQAITDGKDNIDAATTIDEVTTAKTNAVTAVNAIKTKAEKLADAKTDAKADLDTLLDGKTEADYDADDWTALNQAITDGKTAIENATTTDAVATAKNTAVDAVNAVKTKAQKLADAKTTAKNDLDALLDGENPDDYDQADWNALTQAINDAKTAIDAATTLDAVEAAKTPAQQAEANTKTKEQKAAEALQNAKDNAKADLDTLQSGKNQNDYDEADWTTLTQAITDGKTAIDNATTTEAITTAKNNAVDAVNAVKTKAQKELDNAKTSAVNTVNAVNANDYIAADQQTVTDAKTTALAAIEAATTEEEVTTALNNFNNAIASCTTQVVADQIAQVMSEVSAKTGSDMTYTGSPIQLINTPTTALPAGYTMKYAVTTENVKPTDENLYTTSIPAKTDAGTYYVWYKAVGDSDHSDSEAKAITVDIRKKTDSHTHDIRSVESKEPTCTEDGYKEHYECSECGAWFGDITGVSEITDKSGYTIKAIGHKWGAYEVTKRPTYDEEGLRVCTCENDPSHTKEETIPKLTSSSSSDSDSDSGSSGGSGSKNNNVSKQVIDVNGNVKSNVPSNHQVESGVPASDVGGRWANSADADTWTYTKSDGTLAKSEWMSLDYNGLRYWYYFDASGNMQTNWFDYNGKKFYLMPDKDGWRGRMATGWKKIDNKWYYFDITPGETQGSMYTAAITPDGHTVGADGAWNGVGATPVGQE